MKRNLLLVCAAAASVLSYAQPQQVDISEKVVGPGVTWRHEFKPEGPLNYNILEVRLDNPRVTLETESGKDRLFLGEKVLDSVKREEEPGKTEIVGGVNADFWSSSSRLFWPVGLFVADGMIYNMPSRSRSAFVLTKDERPFITPVSLQVTLSSRLKKYSIDRINSGVKSDSEIVLFTPPYGDAVEPAAGKRFLMTTENEEFLPNQPVKVSVKQVDALTTTPLKARSFVLHIPSAKGSNVWFADGDTLQLQATMPEVQGVVASVCGGGPAVVKNGEVNLPLKKEDIANSFSETRHPRTAIGITKDRKTAYLVTVDGRQPQVSIGASLQELGNYMADLGCWEALNLDGGGSTTMVVGEQVVNKPSDLQGPRTVANSLLIVVSDNPN